MQNAGSRHETHGFITYRLMDFLRFHYNRVYQWIPRAA